MFTREAMRVLIIIVYNRQAPDEICIETNYPYTKIQSKIKIILEGKYKQIENFSRTSRTGGSPEIL